MGIVMERPVTNLVSQSESGCVGGKLLSSARGILNQQKTRTRASKKMISTWLKNILNHAQHHQALGKSNNSMKYPCTLSKMVKMLRKIRSNQNSHIGLWECKLVLPLWKTIYMVLCQETQQCYSQVHIQQKCIQMCTKRQVQECHVALQYRGKLLIEKI